MIPSALRTSAAVVNEHQVKAAFLYNFTKFVSWPTESFADPSDPLVFAVLGESHVGLELSLIVKDRKVGGRNLIVRTIENVAEAQTVHVLFVPATEARRLARMKENLDASGLLIVSDAETCALAEANICFVEQGDQLRFTIDAEATKRSRLEISSHLQKLAVNFKKR